MAMLHSPDKEAEGDQRDDEGHKEDEEQHKVTIGENQGLKKYRGLVYIIRITIRIIIIIPVISSYCNH